MDIQVKGTRGTQFEALWVKKSTKKLFIKRVAEETIKGNKLTHDQLLAELLTKK